MKRNGSFLFYLYFFRNVVELNGYLYMFVSLEAKIQLIFVVF